jgi:hypothetical protein
MRLGMGIKKDLFDIGREFGYEKIINTLNQLQEKSGSFYAPDPYVKSISA